MSTSGFSYVNISQIGCEGWLNLFIGEEKHILALVNNKELADLVRAEIDGHQHLIDAARAVVIEADASYEIGDIHDELQALQAALKALEAK